MTDYEALVKQHQEYKAQNLSLNMERGQPADANFNLSLPCLLYTSPSPRDRTRSRMPSSA